MKEHNTERTPSWTNHKMRAGNAEVGYFSKLFAYKENMKSFCLKIFTELSKICIYTLKTVDDSFDTEICVKGVKTMGKIK